MIRRPPRSTPFPYTPLFRSPSRTLTAAVKSLAVDQSWESALETRDLAWKDRRAIYQSARLAAGEDRKSTRLNSSHSQISYAVFCLKKKKKRARKGRRSEEHP